MTIPSDPQADVQQQQSTAVARRSVPTANNPKFRRVYTSSFSRIDWGSGASSISGRRVSNVTAESSNSRATQSSAWGQFATPTSSASSSLASGEMPPIQGDIAASYGDGTIIVLRVRTKGDEEEEAKPKLAPKMIESSYLKLKEEYRKKTERLQRQSITDSSVDECSRKTVRSSSFLSVELPSLHEETTQEKPTEEKQQQFGTAAGGKYARNELVETIRDSDCDDVESTGSKRLVQIMQDAEKRAAANNNMFRFPLWNSNLGLNEFYAPKKKKQTKQPPRLLVSYNGDDEEEEGGKDADAKISVQNNKREEWSLRCQGMVMLLSIVVGIIVCTVLVLALGDNNFFSHDDDKRNDPSNEPSASYFTRQQDMLQLAEQITIACGGDTHNIGSSMSTCQKLCHQHICCVVGDEYSCRDDVEKDCAVYAGCVALIDDIFS